MICFYIMDLNNEVKVCLGEFVVKRFIIYGIYDKYIMILFIGDGFIVYVDENGYLLKMFLFFYLDVFVEIFIMNDI